MEDVKPMLKVSNVKSYVSNNPNLTMKFILDNPDSKSLYNYFFPDYDTCWNWKAISRNSKI